MPCASLAQYTTRDPLMPPPSAPAAPVVGTQQPQVPYPANNEPQPYPSAPAYPYQPDSGTATNLPSGYQPSKSALDPVASDPAANVDTQDSSVTDTTEMTETDAEAAATEALKEKKPDVIIHQPDNRNYTAVRLQGLDKITARTQELEANLGTVTSFGNLEIVPRACWQSQEADKPDSATLLEIWQWKAGEKPAFVFFGWMFASSPGLSSLEHPIYDLTVLGCVENEEDVKAREAEKAKAEKKAAKEKASAVDESVNTPQYD